MYAKQINNIIQTYNSATETEKEQGTLWYKQANRSCLQLANKYGIPIETTSGIVAALSPRARWERNLVDAENIITQRENATVTTFHANKAKALAILSGKNPLDVLGGMKVISFYHNLLLSARHITVDGHIIRVVDPDITNPNDPRIKAYFYSRRYRKIVLCYLIAADILKLEGYSLQATNWLTYKRINKL